MRNKRIYQLIKGLADRYKKHNVSNTAACLAYYFILSFFPFIILINMTIAHMHISSEIIIKILSPLFPENVTDLIVNYNDHIISATNFTTVSIGAVFVVYSASRSIRILNGALLDAYEIKSETSYIRSVVLSVLTTAALIIITALSIAILIISSKTANKIMAYFSFEPVLINTLKICASVFLFLSAVMVLTCIHYVASKAKIEFKKLIFGSFLSMTAVCIASYGFAVYFNNFSNFSAIYGTISAVMLLILWLYCFSNIIVMGAEFNSLLIERKQDLGKAPYNVLNKQ